MILKGNIDETNLLWTDLKVRGQSNHFKDVNAMIDTGFTGELMLPIQLAVQLGLTLVGSGIAELADGSKINQLLFSGNIEWGSVTKDVTISVSDSNDALLGGGLLHGYILIADFDKKDLVLKEPDIDEPNLDSELK